MEKKSRFIENIMSRRAAYWVDGAQLDLSKMRVYGRIGKGQAHGQCHSNCNTYG